MKIILSTGHGRLHFVEMTRALVENRVKPTVTTGWIPKYIPRALVNALGPLVGRNNLHKRLSVRKDMLVSGAVVKSLFWSEAYINLLLLVSRNGLMDKSTAATKGWVHFGKHTKKHLKGDIFHVRSGAGQGGSIAKARRRGMKIVVDQSIAHPFVMQENLEGVFAQYNLPLNMTPKDSFWKLVLEDCEEADVILVNSQYVKDTFVAQGFSESKLRVILWGMRKDFLKLKNDYALGSRKSVRLLFTGAFGLRKGADTIIQAVKLCVVSGLSVHCDVAGNCEEGRAILEKYFSEMHSHFSFHGSLLQEKLRELFKDTDLYVFPSRAEGCARSAMEAMASGLPVVCTPETGTPIEHKKTGYLVERDSPEALALAIQELAANEELRQSIGQSGANYVESNLSWESYGSELKRLYKDLLN